MPPKKICPECRSQVEAEAEHCPNCPYSFQTAEHGVQENRSAETHLRLIAWVVVLGLMAFGAWTVLSFVMRYSDDSTAPIKTNPLAQAVEAHRYRPAPIAGAPVAHEEETVAEEPVYIGAGAIEKEAGPKEWKLRGVVYDLISLKPVPRVTVLFKDAALNRRFETMTDNEGRYRVAIPSLSDRGYSVVLLHQDYAASYLKAGMPEVMAKEAGARRALAQELARSLDPPSTLQGYGRAAVLTDFFIAPMRP